MARNIATTGFVTVVAAFVALYVYGAGALYRLDWEKMSSEKSPDGKYTIEYYRSKSEAGHAPYGDHLVIESWTSFPSPNSGETFFAGYCGNEFTFEWVGNDKIEISCPSLNEEGAIRTRAILVHGISVELTE